MSTTHSLLVAGLGGDPDYELQFQRQAKQIADRYTAAAHEVTLLLGEMVDRDRVAAEIEVLAQAVSRDDVVTFTFVGHGSFDRDEFKFNIPGPDFTATELAEWLDAVPSARQLAVIAASASGGASAALQSDRRTVITATRNGNERIAPVFASYFAEGLDTDAADVNKDRRVTTGEVFDFAKAQVERHYEAGDRIMTEHPQLTGSERGLVLARLAAPPPYTPSSSPVIARRDEIEAAIADLQAAKESWTEDDYFAELQRLLLELAVVESQIEQLESDR